MEGIVRLSDGLLANVSHREDSSTLACGHFAQFIKAVKAGCKTPFDKLQDSDGNLNMSTLSARDDNMRSFCTKGWLQKKMPFAVRAAWPWVPHLAQGALNASNLVASLGHELQTIVQLNMYVKHMSEPDYDAAANAVAPTSACAEYIGSIKDLCKLYFGSKYAHLVDKLALFAKTVGASARMGQEFTTALVDSNSRGGSSLEPCVRLRAGCMAVKLTAAEVVDGVYGLMSGSDIRKLLTMPEAPAFEAAFQHADEVVQALAGIVEEKVLVASECALWIRTIEFAIKLWTPQCTKNEFESFEHIKAKFAHEIAIYMHRHNQGLNGGEEGKESMRVGGSRGLQRR